MATLDEIRAKAQAHAKQLEAVTFATTHTLAARWGVSATSVLAIPREWLPYLEFGRSRMRRYDPRDVEAFEAACKRGEYTLPTATGASTEDPGDTEESAA